jgi:S-adenosylmethionine hydrolase
VSKSLRGVVIAIDESGDLITDIHEDQWSPLPAGVSTRVVIDGEHETFGIHPPDCSLEPMTLAAIGEPGKPLRICLLGDSAAEMLFVRRGASITIHW